MTDEKQAVKTLAEEFARALNAIRTDARSVSASNIVGLPSAMYGVLSTLDYKRSEGDEVAAKILNFFHNISSLEVGYFAADEAKIGKLYATFGKFMELVAEKANIGTLDVNALRANMAVIGLLSIGTAQIKQAQIEQLSTDDAFIRAGVGDKLYIDDLAVSNANIVNLAAGTIMIKDPATGKMVELYVNEQGGISTRDVSYNGNDIINSNSLNGGRIIENTLDGDRIIENTITANRLNASEIFAAEGDIMDLVSYNINASRIHTGSLDAGIIKTGYLDAGIVKAGILGDLNGSNYWNMETGDLRISPNATVGDATTAYTIATAHDISNLQNQIDGNITTWFYAVDPALNNPPADEWTTDALKNIHLGDLYYNTISGYCWRWQITNSVYGWQRITDTDVTKALADSAAALDLADNKRRVFVTTPVPPYDVGDLWLKQDDEEIMRCQTAKIESESFAAADWVKASKYTDDTTVTNLDNSLNQQGVFNRLTNNGQTQGIYLYQNKLYINADYIGAGTIDAHKVRVKNLSANYLSAGSVTFGSIQAIKNDSSLIISNENDPSTLYEYTDFLEQHYEQTIVDGWIVSDDLYSGRLISIISNFSKYMNREGTITFYSDIESLTSEIRRFKFNIIEKSSGSIVDSGEVNVNRTWWLPAYASLDDAIEYGHADNSGDIIGAIPNNKGEYTVTVTFQTPSDEDIRDILMAKGKDPSLYSVELISFDYLVGFSKAKNILVKFDDEPGVRYSYDFSINESGLKIAGLSIDINGNLKSSKNATFGGIMNLTRTTDASGTADNGPALIIGTRTGTHLELDNNEIMAKASGTTVGNLSLNFDGGNIQMGAANTTYNVQVRSTQASTSKTTGALVVGGGAGFGGTVYANAFNGPLTGSVTGNVTGNISGYSGVGTRTRTSLVKGTNPSSTTWQSLWYNWQSTGSEITDRVAGGIESYVNTSGLSAICLRAYQYASGSSTTNTMEIRIAKDGTCSYALSSPEAFKAALNLGTAAMDVRIGSYDGVVQHWGIGAIVQATTKGTKAYLGKRTSLVITDTGCFLYNNTDSDTIWSCVPGNYVLKAGSTMTGTLTLKASTYYADGGGINANNSDIIGVNGIFAKDAAETFGEGINFYRSATPTWDSMVANGGVFYFGSNKATSAALLGDAAIRCGTIHSRGDINILSTVADGTSATNGITETTYKSFTVRDKNEVWATTFRGKFYTDGRIGGNIAVRNYVSGSWSEKTMLEMTVANNGSIVYSMTDPGAFKTALSLNNVENTKLSTWGGTSNIATVGTITSGTWNAGGITSSGNIVLRSTATASDVINRVITGGATNNSTWTSNNVTYTVYAGDWGNLRIRNRYKSVSSGTTTWVPARIEFRAYSATANSGTHLSYYDAFALPGAADGKTANNTYNILTTKAAVTVAQGGTGATTGANAVGNLYGTTYANQKAAWQKTGILTKKVATTTDSNGNVDLGISNTNYMIISILENGAQDYSIGAIAYCNYNDVSYRAHCFRVNTSHAAIASKQVSLCVVYAPIPADF